MTQITQENTTEFPSLTIVISTGDRPKMLYDCIRSMSDTEVPASVELIVVDAGQDEVVDDAEVGGLWSNSSVIHMPEKNMARQRNEGVRRASGDIACFIDDDSYIQAGWYPEILKPFADHDVAVVAGAVWCNPEPDFTDRRGGYVDLIGRPVQVTHRSERAPREVDWSVGCNMAFRKSIYCELGGLAEVFGIYDEDIDLGLRVRNAGWRVIFQASAPVYHYCNTRPHPPPTKTAAFLAGRNRCMVLVRNYGFSPRLVFFLLTAPLIRLACAIKTIFGQTVKSSGHWIVYIGGIACGLINGARNPTGSDRDRFEK